MIEKKLILRKGLIILLSGVGVLLLSLFYFNNSHVNNLYGIDSNLINSRSITAIGIKDHITFESKVIRDKKYINDFILTIYQLREVENNIPENQLTGNIQKVVFHREGSFSKAGGDYTMFVFNDLGIILFGDRQYQSSNEFTSILRKIEENSQIGWW